MQVHELVSPAVFREHCTGDSDETAKQLCFIAYLPDILDTKASGRNAYIKALRKVADKYKDRPYSYFWAVGGAHPELERNMDVGGFGYPALSALSPKRKVYALVLCGVFGYTSALHSAHIVQLECEPLA